MPFLCVLTDSSAQTALFQVRQPLGIAYSKVQVWTIGNPAWPTFPINCPASTGVPSVMIGASKMNCCGMPLLG